MKRTLLIFSAILFLLLPKSLYCMYGEGFVFSPGVKFGYSFGEKGGVVIGLELTVGYLTLNNSLPIFSGIVANIDLIDNYNVRVMVAGEVQAWPFPGLTFGPGWLFTEDKTYFGLCYGTYLSMGVLNLSYNYTNFGRHTTESRLKPVLIDFNDIVIQAKLPILSDKINLTIN